MRFALLFLLAPALLLSGCKDRGGNFNYFRNYSATFNDMNNKHLMAAKEIGITPIASLNKMNGKLLKVTDCDLFEIDRLTYSHPYLVAEAYRLLVRIGRNFQDSLSRKSLPPYKLIVTSILRTNESVSQLRKKNINASENSAHIYGSTFDIAYARYKKSSYSETDRDKLKSVLAEVLRDLQKAAQCYVRYEYKQGCFHITARPEN